MLISFSGNSLEEGSIYYSQLTFMLNVLPTFTSWRYWLPETNNPKKTLKWAFPAGEGPEGRTWEPSALLYISQRADSWPSAFILCLPIPESKPLTVLQHQWIRVNEWMENYPSASSPCFPAPHPELEASPGVCVCGFCCLQPGFIRNATSIERNPLSSLVLGSLAGWHWRYMWTLGTVLLERQVRICQNTTVNTCRKKKKDVGFYSQSFCCGQLGLVHPHGMREVTEGQLFRVQGDTRCSGHFPACRHLTQKDPFSSPVVFVPSCPKKSAGSAVVTTRGLSQAVHS